MWVIRTGILTRICSWHFNGHKIVSIGVKTIFFTLGVVVGIKLDLNEITYMGYLIFSSEVSVDVSLRVIIIGLKSVNALVSSDGYLINYINMTISMLHSM